MSDEERPSWWERIHGLLERYDAMLRLGHEAEARRELEEQEDVVMLLLFSEAMGLPNPAAYYTLELYPMLIEQYHAWHQRMGMERSPLDHVRCC